VPLICPGIKMDAFLKMIFLIVYTNIRDTIGKEDNPKSPMILPLIINKYLHIVTYVYHAHTHLYTPYQTTMTIWEMQLKSLGLAQWLMTVISATWVAEIGGLWFKSNPRQKVCKILSQNQAWSVNACLYFSYVGGVCKIAIWDCPWAKKWETSLKTN
jgi:hypothetical protein